MLIAGHSDMRRHYNARMPISTTGHFRAAVATFDMPLAHDRLDAQAISGQRHKKKVGGRSWSKMANLKRASCRMLLLLHVALYDIDADAATPLPPPAAANAECPRSSRISAVSHRRAIVC